MKISRQMMIDALAAAFEPLPFVHAAWLGGSDASGRTDAWSDIDIQIVVDDDAVEQCFEITHEVLERLSPIAHRFRLPSPTWHGHEQEFLSLNDADACHFVDFVVLKRSSKDWFLERERHGDALVLFDKEGLVKAPPFDRAAHVDKMEKRLAVLREVFPLFQNLTVKAARRRAAADAMMTYMTQTIRPVVEILRMRYCPDRYDYGLRYLDRDLPADVGAEIERLVFPPSVEEVEAYQARAQKLFDETIRALDAGEWRIEKA
jgi:predicted nucleotidyltransferase